MPANSRWDLIQRLRVKIVKNPGNKRLNNLNDLVLDVLTRSYTICAWSTLGKTKSHLTIVGGMALD